jgi:hypothetical protein
MAILVKLRKRWAIRGYARKLPRMLRQDYGFSRSYTPLQINRTIERNRLNVEHASYAVAMFSDEESFARYQPGVDAPREYEAMRTEIADTYFEGNIDFTVRDITDTFGGGAHDGGGHGHDGGGGDSTGNGHH